MEYTELTTKEAVMAMIPDLVFAYSVASPGANGAPGTVKLITAGGIICKFDYLKLGINLREWPKNDDPRVAKNMGLGNVLYIRPEDEAALDEKLSAFKDEPLYPNIPLYKNWPKFCLEIMNE